MPTKLNLATKPFSNRSLPWVVTTLVIAVSLISLALIVRAANRANDQAAAVQSDINNLKRQELELHQKAQAVKNSLTTEQLQTLVAAHTLVDRKHFSWSRLFADLEGVLPQSVRVARIAVRQVHSQGDHMVANLELMVTAKSPTAVTDMIAVMDKEGIFQAELRNVNLQKGRGEGGSEYELMVKYSPRASFASTSDVRAANDHVIGTGGLR